MPESSVLLPMRNLSAIMLLTLSMTAWGNPLTDNLAFSAHFENDLFADTDAQYTNGMKFTVVSPDLKNFFHKRDALPDWAKQWIEDLDRDFSRYIPFITRQDVTRTLAFSLGQNIYTPEDISQTNLNLSDRPYAGWLYFATTFQTRSTDRQDTIDVQFGITGPLSFAEQAQDTIHRIRDIDRPQGWDHQIRTEPGLVLAYERILRHTLLEKPGNKFGMDLLTRFGGALGNIATFASTGAQLRAGWNVPEDFGYSVIRPGGVTQVNALDDPGHTGRRVKRGLSFYLFAGVEGRGVLRDVFLDGNTFRDSHSVDRKPFVADFMTGATLGYGNLKLSFAKVLRTREFRGQPNDHRFGSITLSYAYD